MIQETEAMCFDIYTNYTNWDVVRCIWIAFHKNDEKNNKSCYFYKLPKDIIKYVIKFLGGTVLQADDKTKFVAL